MQLCLSALYGRLGTAYSHDAIALKQPQPSAAL